MHRVIFNAYVDATLAAIFVMVVVTIAVFGVICIRRALGCPAITATEVGGVAPREQQMAEKLKFWDLVTRTAIHGWHSDYENYVQHRQTCHLGEPVMSYEDFLATGCRRATPWARGNSGLLLRQGEHGGRRVPGGLLRLLWGGLR